MSNKLVILRHASASPTSESRHDKDRTLTNQGQTEAKVISRQILQMTGLPVTVVTSPYTRAIQTAWHLSTTAEVDSRLGADRDLHGVIDLIRERAVDRETLVLVSHMPLVEELLCVLTGQTKSTVVFAPGTAVFLTMAIPKVGYGEIVGVLAPWMFTQT
jgi:phosphohistidine phosphatase SixA